MSLIANLAVFDGSTSITVNSMTASYSTSDACEIDLTLASAVTLASDDAVSGDWLHCCQREDVMPYVTAYYAPPIDDPMMAPKPGAPNRVIAIDDRAPSGT
jgi:hypothetical protein